MNTKFANLNNILNHYIGVLTEIRDKTIPAIIRVSDRLDELGIKHRRHVHHEIDDIYYSPEIYIASQDGKKEISICYDSANDHYFLGYDDNRYEGISFEEAIEIIRKLLS